MVRSLVKALSLSKGEAEHFEAMVQLDQATNSRARNLAWRRVAASRAFSERRPTVAPAVRYYSDWWIPVVRELARRSDFCADPKWIASQIRPAITEAQAKGALQTLHQLELLETQPDGSVRVTDTTVRPPSEVDGLSTENHHRSLLERAIDGIDGIQRDERHYLAATVGVPRSMVPVLKAELDAFHQQLMERCGSLATHAEQVVSCSSSCFPSRRAVTRPVDAASRNRPRHRRSSFRGRPRLSARGFRKPDVREGLRHAGAAPRVELTMGEIHESRSALPL